MVVESVQQKPAAPNPHDAAAAHSVEVLRFLFGACHEPAFAVRLWDGTTWTPAPESPPQFTLVLHHPGALRTMFLPPTLQNVGESFVRGDWDVEGDIVACAGLADTVAPLLSHPDRWPVLARLLMRLPDRHAAEQSWRGAAHLHGEQHSKERDEQAVRFHYDLPAEFYALFLGERMQYSCAYFRTGEESLDEAQAAKLEHICRKLRLRPGERLLDIGCGWGGLLAYAAEHYGVEGLGITLSPVQAEWARRHLEQAGLARRCRIDVRDYRDLDGSEVFDKIVSVGMFEHVGRAKLHGYLEQAYRLLKPGGSFLNHGIANFFMPHTSMLGNMGRRVLDRVDNFVGRHVFPDGELTPVSWTNTIAEQVGFELRDVESLREHYALTLRRWEHNLEVRREKALRVVDEPTYRIWRLYIAGCAHSFDVRSISIYQSLLLKPCPDGRAGLPLTREWLYQEEGSG